MKLTEVLKPELIKLDLQATKKCQAIREVADLLSHDPRVLDFKKFYEEMLERERINTTNVGNELAFPHARIDQLTDMVVAVGRSMGGVDFQDSGQANVKLIFAIGTPRKMVTDYLRVVGGLARILKQADIRQRLMAAPTSADFITIIGEAENQM